jgi:EmrB/QacA subfamily drug resistance transporter
MEYKWKALSVTSVGSLMAAVDSTIVLLAILPMAQDLRSDFVVMVWVVIAYLLANTAFVLSLGRIGDMYGRKKMYNLGFVIFTAGSVLCGLATSAPVLVAFRALQGLGAAMLTANSFAILSEAFPPQERGKGFGVIAIVWGVGSILGIVLGGFLISFTSWRWIFLINLPVGVFGTWWAWRALHAVPSSGRKESFDLPGAALFTLALSAFLFGVTWGLLHAWTDAVTLGCFALAAVGLVAFLAWELRAAKDPIVPFDVFGNWTFTLSTSTAAVQSLATFSVNFLLVFYLEGIAGLDVLTASYLIVPMALVTALVGPFAGRVSDRIGARVVATAGLVVQAVALVVLSRLSTGTPLVEVALVEAGFGLGAGLFWAPNTSTIMSAAPRGRYGVASGLMNTFRNTGMVLSFALALVATTRVIPKQVVNELFVGNFTGRLPASEATAYLSGQSFAFVLSAALVGLAAVLSLLRQTPAPAPRREEADVASK